MNAIVVALTSDESDDDNKQLLIYFRRFSIFCWLDTKKHNKKAFIVNQNSVIHITTTAAIITSITMRMNKWRSIYLCTFFNRNRIKLNYVILCQYLDHFMFRLRKKINLMKEYRRLECA